MSNLLWAIVLAVIIVILYNLWFRPEYLTDDEIAQSLIANAMIRDPQDSTAVIMQMPAKERRKYERMVPLPYDPNFYKERMVPLPYDPNFYKERMVPDKFKMVLNA